MSSRERIQALANNWPLLAILGVLWTTWGIARSRFLYEWDSANYALGSIHFDIYSHQPHPPGYPLWIALIDALNILTHDANLAQTLLAGAFSTAAAVVFLQLAHDHLKSREAFAATALVTLCPNALLYSLVSANYAADFFVSTLLGWLSFRSHERSRLIPVMTFTLGFFAGLRQSGAVLLTPLVCYCVIRAYARDWKAISKSALAGLVGVLMWWLPTGLLHGGPLALQRYSASWIRTYFGWSSVLFGASLTAHTTMIRHVVLWLSMSLLPTALVAVAARLIRTEQPSPRSTASQPLAVYGLWLLPNVLYVTLFHCPKPGYLLLSLPPLVLLLVTSTKAQLAHLKSRELFALVGMSLLIAHLVNESSFIRNVDDRMSIRTARSADKCTQEVLQVIRDRPHSRSELEIIDLASPPLGPNFRTLSYYVPEARVAWEVQDAEDHRGVGADGERVIPPRTREILWLTNPSATLALQVEPSPQATLLLSTEIVSVWSTDVGEDPLDMTIRPRNTSVHFTRH